ncbi:MAG: acyl-CoA thioesterase, partial [Candidatus Planktophila sp.]|nr:acyl-CoA thioesterase [Candidatus Planktophila sp.]
KCKAHVRWNDLDAFGHVNNANYLTYVQESRADFTWWSRKRAGEKPLLADMVVARAEVDFLEPIYEGGFDLDVEIWVTKIGNASFDLAYQMSSNGNIHANAKTVQVAVSMETKKSRPLNDIEREYLGRYLEA